MAKERWTAKKATAINTPEEKKEAKPLPKPEMKEPENYMGVGNVWFDASSGKYLREDSSKKWIDYKEADFKRYLKFCHWSTKTGEHETISPLDRLMVQIHQHRRVAFAGEIAGYKPGRYTICGQHVIVPKGNKLAIPKRGPWNTIKTVVNELLGMQQAYFYAWLKAAYESLAAGPPWRPGQMLAIAGESGCGKSLLQNLITEMLGGRSAKPYGFLCGETNFNSTYLGAEHWMIEDEASGTDIRTRRHFASKIKNSIVNQVHDYKPKGRDCVSVTPYIRLTMTLNDNPESMMVLPPIDEDIADKIILLKASKITPPFQEHDLGGRAKFWNRLVAEIPAFLSAMGRAKIPDHMKDSRYGVAAYHNPDLLAAVEKLSPESKLLSIIDATEFFDDFKTQTQGKAFDIEKELRRLDRSGQVDRLLSFNTACGVYLARLAKKRPDRVQILQEDNGQNIYLLGKSGITL